MKVQRDVRGGTEAIPHESYRNERRLRISGVEHGEQCASGQVQPIIPRLRRPLFVAPLPEQLSAYMNRRLPPFAGERSPTHARPETSSPARTCGCGSGICAQDDAPDTTFAIDATSGKLQYAPLVFKGALTAESAAPDEFRAELLLRLGELASTLASIPAHHHSVWSSPVDSDLRLDVRGWQFLYRVDPPARRITVHRGGPSSTLPPPGHPFHGVFSRL